MKAANHVRNSTSAVPISKPRAQMIRAASQSGWRSGDPRPTPCSTHQITRLETRDTLDPRDHTRPTRPYSTTQTSGKCLCLTSRLHNRHHADALPLFDVREVLMLGSTIDTKALMLESHSTPKKRRCSISHPRHYPRHSTLSSTFTLDIHPRHHSPDHPRHSTPSSTINTLNTRHPTPPLNTLSHTHALPFYQPQPLDIQDSHDTTYPTHRFAAFCFSFVWAATSF